MKATLLGSHLASVLLVLLFVTNTYAQTDFVYTNNDTDFFNSVSAYAVSANGVLTQIPASPFSTGGPGGSNLFAANRITISAAGNFLYVANSLGSTAAIQLFSHGRTFSITDRDLRNDTCTCR